MIRILWTRCRMCERSRHRSYPLCANCLERFAREADDAPSPRVVEGKLLLHSAFRYAGFPRDLFLKAKFSRDRALADFLISAAFPRMSPLFHVRILIPVPPVRRRLVKRGFSLPDRMAYRFSRLSGRPWTTEGVYPASGRQTKFLDRKGRAHRRGRWSASPGGRIPGDGLFLLDDLAATGHTLLSFRDFWVSRGYAVSGSAALFDVPSFSSGAGA
jgi:competence protein ComFC